MTDNLRTATLLQDAGLKQTRQRMELLKLISASKSPMSAEDLYAKLKKHDYLISLSTVYRTLETLVDKKLVDRIVLDNESHAFYEFRRDLHHHYLVCLGCNKIIKMAHCPIHEEDFKDASESGFEVVGHKLEIYGYCHECGLKLDKRAKDTA